MPHRRILLVNPPLVGGVAFTRQGRCQEREEVLGTTKPPYSLLVIAALLREQGGASLRLVDLTAEGRTTASLVDELKRDGFTPELVVFPSTTPTLHADTAEMVDAQARVRRAARLLRAPRLNRAGRGDASSAGRGRHGRRRARGRR